MGALSQAIESEVSGALHCTLEHVDLRLQPPTAEQFHVNLQDLLKRGACVRACVCVGVCGPPQ